LQEVKRCRRLWPILGSSEEHFDRKFAVVRLLSAAAKMASGDCQIATARNLGRQLKAVGKRIWPVTASVAASPLGFRENTLIKWLSLERRFRCACRPPEKRDMAKIC
jgi:hypothetical protein